MPIFQAHANILSFPFCLIGIHDSMLELIVVCIVGSMWVAISLLFAWNVTATRFFMGTRCYANFLRGSLDLRQSLNLFPLKQYEPSQ